MTLILGFTLMCIFGYLIIFLINDRVSLEEKIALSFGLGIGFLTLLMFYLSRLGISQTPVNILLILILSIIFLKIILDKKNLIPNISFNWKTTGLVSLCLLFLIVVTFVFNKLRIFINPKAFVLLSSLLSVFSLGGLFLRRKQISQHLIIALIIFSFLGILALGIYWPINEWDSLALYDFVGKLFSSQNSISFSANLPNLDYYIGYPLLTPIAHAFVYLLGGQNPRFIYPLFYISMLLIFFSFLKKETTSAISLFFTLILGTTSMVFEQGTSSYTNLPFAFYQITAALFLYRFLKERKRKDLLLSGIIFGLSAWTRSVSEPYFLACFLILIIYLPKLKLTEKLYLSVGFLLLYLVIGFPWQIYVRYLGVVSFSVGWMVQKNIYTLNQYPQNYFNIDALGKVVERLLTILADFKLFGAGGILFFLSFILSRRSIKKEKILILLIFLNLCFWILSIYGLGVVVSFRESWENILQDSMSRVFLGIYPLLLFYVAKTDLIFEIFDGKKK